MAMGQNEPDRRQPVGQRTATPAGVYVRAYCTTATAARQPAWIASKAAADRAWPGVVSLVRFLGFGTPTATPLAQDWQGCDFYTPDGKRWGWRNRDRRYLGFHDVTVRKARPNGAATECQKWGASDFALWTWSEPSGVVTDWLLLRADRVTPLLGRSWPTLTMSDATAVCVPWRALAEAGAVVTASRGIIAALQSGA